MGFRSKQGHPLKHEIAVFNLSTDTNGEWIEIWVSTLRLVGVAKTSLFYRSRTWCWTSQGFCLKRLEMVIGGRDILRNFSGFISSR